MERYGRYELLTHLATGGMAEVFLARPAGQKGLDKLVVIKRILPHLAENEEFVSMFLQEARVAARLAHPRIARVFDVGKVGQTFFMAMEHVAGEDFRHVARQANRMGSDIPPSLVCRMIIGAAEGLHFAHNMTDEQGRPLEIVHRDVSPQNLFLTFDGEVKVLDFGVARAADNANQTRTGVLKGKYSYMSPEQVEGRILDHRSDVFALGIVLYELVTRKRLFKRSSPHATLKAVVDCVVPPPSSHNPEIDPELERIIFHALAPKPGDRLPSAAALATELQTYLERRRVGSTDDLRVFIRGIYADKLAEQKRLASTHAAPSSRAPEAPKPTSSKKRRRDAVELAPMPSERPSLSAPPPARASRADEDSVSRVVRRARRDRVLSILFVMTLFALFGGLAVLLMRS